MDCMRALAGEPYWRAMMRMPAALAAAAARVDVPFGAAVSRPSETTIMTGVAEGVRRGPVSSDWAAAIPAPILAMSKSTARLAVGASPVSGCASKADASKETTPKWSPGR